jgi:phosphoribosylamine-glycine ligase
VTNFLFVSDEALSADLAWQLTKAGHEVKFFTKSQSEKDVGDGFVEKADAWEPLKDWAEVIVFDDIGFGGVAEKLRAEGKAVVGGSVYTDKLENNREFGQTELKDAGVSTLPSWNFTSFDEAIEFVKNKPDRYVIKPSGDAQNEKELLFVGQEEDGKDVEQVLVHYKMKWSNKIKFFQIQKYETGVEVGIGAFFNGHDFVYPININFEHKRLFPKNIGPSTGEMGTSCYWTKNNPLFENTLLKTKDKLAESKYVGYIDLNCIANSKGIFPLEWTCFDAETEILTRSGWKQYFELVDGEETLAINPSTRDLEWKRIAGLIVKDYRGKMVHLGAKRRRHAGLDALVTPDHNLLIETSGKMRFAKAGKIPIHETHIVRTGRFVGKQIETVEIPSYVEQHHLGRHGAVMEILHESISVPAQAFMKFLGVYLAEGSVGGHHHIVNLSQSNENKKRELIENVLRETGLKYTAQKNGIFQISSTQLVKFLDQLGLSTVEAQDKFIPSQFKDLSTELLEALWYGYSLGDGNTHKRTGQQSAGTTSARLAGDLQELLIKCGKLSNIRISKQKGKISIGGYVRKNDLHVLSMRTRKLDYSLDKRVISRESYSGKVWDVEVEDFHTMLVRRHGKPFFSGNCRFGYPTISIQMEGVTSEWGAFLADIAQGKDAQRKTKKGYQVGVVVAIPPFPFEDDKAFRKYSEDATILFRKPNLTGVHIGEVKLVEGDWHVAGKSGYVLVITGSGPSMQEAINTTYQAVRNVMIPNMFYRDDIGERWFKDVDLLLSWGYL